MNFSVFKGKSIFGNESFMLAPISELLKRELSLSPASFDAPILPFADNSRISAFLNTFLIRKEELNPIPNC